MRIYRIQLEGHGKGARLKARHLSTFTVPGTGKFTSVDVSGELLARSRRTKEGSFLEVLKWQQSTSITHTRVRIPVDQGVVSHCSLIPLQPLIESRNKSALLKRTASPLSPKIICLFTRYLPFKLPKLTSLMSLMWSHPFGNFPVPARASTVVVSRPFILICHLS